MEGVDVGAGDGQVFLDHLHRAVAEDDLQAVGIPPISQVENCKGVAEAVRVDIAHPSAAGDADELLAQAVAIWQMEVYTSLAGGSGNNAHFVFVHNLSPILI